MPRIQKNIKENNRFKNLLKKTVDIITDEFYYTLFIVCTLIFAAYYYLTFVPATIIFVGIMLYIGEGYSIIIEWVKYKYSRFRSLNDLVSTRYKGILSILFYSIVILLKAFWYGMLNFFDNRLEKIDKHKSILNYTHNGRVYSILFINRRTPDDVMQVIDENSNDVTDRVLPFIRFQEQVLRITPKSLGYKNLEIITTSRDDPLNFNEDETIIVK